MCLLPSLYLWVFLIVFPMGYLLAKLVSKYLFPSRFLPISASLVASFPAGVLQASELGMISAFYKYILTTMVRTPSSPCIPSHSICTVVPGPGLTLLLVPGLPHPAPGRDCGGLLQHPGLLHVQHLAPLLPRVCAQPQHVLERELRSQHLPGTCGEHTPSPLHTDTLHTDTLGPFRSLPVGAQSLWCSHSLPMYVPCSLILSKSDLSSSPPPRAQQPHWPPGASAALAHAHLRAVHLLSPLLHTHFPRELVTRFLITKSLLTCLLSCEAFLGPILKYGKRPTI